MYEQVEQLVKSGVEMEEALLAKTADGEEMEARIETLARTAAEAQEAMAAQEKVAAALQEQVEGLRAKGEAETNVMVASCEKRMKMLEYDLIAKQEEVNRMEQVKTEAYHKMTLMKAEYTGRVKRRDDKVPVCLCVSVSLGLCVYPCVCVCVCMCICM